MAGKYVLQTEGMDLPKSATITQNRYILKHGLHPCTDGPDYPCQSVTVRASLSMTIRDYNYPGQLFNSMTKKGNNVTKKGNNVIRNIIYCRWPKVRL
jgi:hypothetical protein